MAGSISSTGNEGSSQPISTPTIQKFTDLDQKIQKKAQGILYHLFGFGAKDVKKLRIERFQLAKDLISSIDSTSSSGKTSLNKISEVMQKEVARLEKRGNKSDLILDHQKIRETIVQKTGSSVIQFSDVKIKGEKGTHEAFNSGNNADPDFKFSLTLGSGVIDLKGAGKTESGDFKAQGGFGRVYFGENAGKSLAVKVMEVKPGEEADIEREIAYLHDLKGSPNIMSSHEVVRIIDDKGKLAYVCILMDHMEGGDLSDKLKDKNFSTKDRVKAFKEAAIGVAKLHEEGILHRDIKEENLLYSETQGTKVADLGFCITAEKWGLVDIAGTPQYYAPEVKEAEEKYKELAKTHESEAKQKAIKYGNEAGNRFLKDSIKAGMRAAKLRRPGKPADVYSFGIMMIRGFGDPKVVDSKDFLGKLGSSKPLSLDEGLFEKLPENIRGDVFSLVEQCLTLVPGDRITMENLKNELANIEKKMENAP